MKNMVAMSAMVVLLFARSGRRAKRDIIFAGVADEEAGSHLGALHLVEKHPDLIRAEYVLNEIGGHTLHIGPTRYYPIQVAEKGICWFELHADGSPGHGSMPHRDSAIDKVAAALHRLAERPLPLHVTPVVDRFIRTLSQRSSVLQRLATPLMLQPAFTEHLLRLVALGDASKARGLRAMLRNTATPTRLAAGTKINVIPSTAQAAVDGRIVPGVDVATFLEEVQAIVGESVRLNVLDQHDGVTFPSTTPLYEAICRTLRAHDPEGVPVPYMIPGFTDSFAYARLGTICYGFSPTLLGPTDDFTAMYHGDDERIPVEGFLWGLRVLHDLIDRFCF